MTVSPIKFYVRSSGSSALSRKRNVCVLKFIEWNDYGFMTSFTLYYWTAQGNRIELGRLRVMSGHMGEERQDIRKEIPNEFQSLSNQFCSLGRQHYYESMATLPDDIKDRILRSLNDCAFNTGYFNSFHRHPVMNDSLLREIDVQKVQVLFPSIIQGRIILTPYRFRYLLDHDDQLSIDFTVEPNSTPPTNIHVLIGRNGVGKTRIISGIMDQLTKIENVISLDGTLEFIDENNLDQKFANLVTVVFSAFDHFKPPPVNNKIKGSTTAHYVGLKKENGNEFKSPKKIEREFSRSIDAISESSVKRQLWIDMVIVLGADPIFDSYELHKFNLNSFENQANVKQIFKELSSGHRIVLLTTSRLVELVDERSLVLIDEPENHLHPPLLSSFIRAVSDLLIRRNGVAIIATHSPVVLQEVPSSCVTKINRIADRYDLHRPKKETYAENIDTLSRDVFGLELEESGFYKTIRQRIHSSPDYSFDDFMSEFGNKVGSEGRVLAKSLLASKED